MEQADAEWGEAQGIIAAQSVLIASQHRKLVNFQREDEEASVPTASDPSASSSGSSEDQRPPGGSPRPVTPGRQAWRRLRVKIARVSHERKVEAFEAGKALVTKDLENSERIGARLVHRVGGIRPARKDPVRELGRSFKRGINRAIRDYLRRSAEQLEQGGEAAE